MAKIYLAIDQDHSLQQFDNWDACKQFVHGTPMRFASGRTVEEAKRKLGLYEEGNVQSDRPTIGICSDASTRGNPGPSEFQVTDLSGVRIAHEDLGERSNNFAELKGVLAMIKVGIRDGVCDLWTDSQVVLSWIGSGRVGENARDREAVVEIVEEARKLLKANTTLRLKKWQTKSWGEIPADFGRK